MFRLAAPASAAGLLPDVRAVQPSVTVGVAANTAQRSPRAHPLRQHSASPASWRLRPLQLERWRLPPLGASLDAGLDGINVEADAIAGAQQLAQQLTQHGSGCPLPEVM